jgi:photosystem II stability/assembly factor-like uncharacterized protein
VATDPSLPLVLYAATEDGVFRSTNGGDLWQVSGLGGESIRDVLIDPSNPARAWASVAWDAIHRTTDSGASWHPASDGIEGHRLFYDVKVSASGETLYAVGWDAYRSVDGGDSWAEMGAGSLPTTGTFYEIAVDPKNAAELHVAYFGGEIYRSLDAGLTWDAVTPIASDLVEYQTISADPYRPECLLAGAYGGEVYISHADGETWQEFADGISTAHMLSIGICGNRWLAGTRRGVYVSETWGRSWAKSDLVYDIGAEINSIAMVPPDGMTVFCGTTNGFYKGDVYRSTDGGSTWNLIKFGDGPVTALAIDPMNSDLVYAGYSCDVIPGGVYRSTDGGESWIEESLGSVCVYALQIDATNPAVVLAGTTDGVFRSTDHGDSWHAQDLSGVPVVDFSTDYALPFRIYAATYGYRAYASNDYGVTWNPIGGAELPAHLYSIEGDDPSAGVLAGTQTSGIWRFTGTEWERLDNADQPPVGEIRALLAHPETGRFLAGTHGAGIWEYLSDPAHATEEPIARVRSLDILGSPSAGPFTIRLILPTRGAVAIDLVDVTGRRVRRITTEYAAEGLFEWSWDGRDEMGRLAEAGLYLVRARTDRGVWSGKICVLR